MDGLLSAMHSFISNSWRIFVDVHVPVLDIPIASVFVGLLFVDFGMRFLSFLLGFGFGGISVFGATSRRVHNAIHEKAGNGGSVKVSADRRNDEF